MKFVIFGLTISSSWGNGHATLLRGLFRALVERGHRVVFFERDVPYYADHRDFIAMPGVALHLYSDWTQTLPLAGSELEDADVAMVTSYCPDGIAASEEILASPAGIRAFYDLDTPITLSAVAAGQSLNYVGSRGLGDFDLVLSYTGGMALDGLRQRLGAQRVIPLYGSVDPVVHRRVEARSHYRSDLSYLGTFAEDRQKTLEALFIAPARQLPGQKFVIGGVSYPLNFPWLPNIFFVRHLPPPEHPAFYSSSRLTLNVTRQSMAQMGYCPSGRLFEAAACGTPILSDMWEGLDQFFEPGEEILLADRCADAVGAMSLGDATLARIARRARERTMDCHTAAHRAAELESILESAADQRAQTSSLVAPSEQPGKEA